MLIAMLVKADLAELFLQAVTGNSRILIGRSSDELLIGGRNMTFH
jgi:hypothetical protein